MDHRKNLRKYGKRLDSSLKFLNWVQALHFEQTTFKKLWVWAEQNLRIKLWGLIFVYCLFLSFIVFFDLDFGYHGHVGEVASVDIKSPISFQIVDESATREKRKSAADSVPPVFDYDRQQHEQVLNRVYKAFRDLRKEVHAVRWPRKSEAHAEAIKKFVSHKAEFEKDLGIEVPQNLFEWLTEHKFAARFENIIIRTLTKWSQRKTVDGQNLPSMNPNDPVLVRVVGPEKSSSEEFIISRGDVRDVRKLSEFNLDGVMGVDELSNRDQRDCLELAKLLIVPNMTYNKQETIDRRAKASEAVLPVQISIKRNQTIVSEGSVIRPIHMTLLNEIKSLQKERRSDFIALAVAFLFMIVVTVFFSYLRRIARNRIKIDGKDIYAMAVVLTLIVCLTKLYMFISAAAFTSRFSSTIPASSFLYAAPVAAGPMLVGLMISSGEIVWLFTIFISITVALMVGPNVDLAFLLVSAIGGIAAARGVFLCTKRNDIYRAGIRTGLVNAAVLAVLTFLQPRGEMSYLYQMLWNAAFGFAGGMLASMVAMTFIPLLESLFNYTTDVKLLELSNLNHPLMKDMIVKAPGTYHHSLVVGSMCEAAAEEIGANPLLAKVMAYYHDIGKMEHAQYFIENQRPGHNAHDHISPHMSKTVLIAHVKDGAEMGYRHKLGKAIIDGILQHHGTTLISYFYNRAIEEQDENIDTVNENDFRYPGPKPQFKEAALLMVADSIEAAARSLDEPTAARLTSLVKNIIQNKFLDGQLDECDLSLKDLSVIEECYRRVILGIYHQRIDYPQSPDQQHRFQVALPPGPSVSRPAGKKKSQLA